MARKIISFTGNNGVGNISVSGVEAGDEIIAVLSTALNSSNLIANFGVFVMADGEILQVVSSDLSTISFVALLDRRVILP